MFCRTSILKLIITRLPRLHIFANFENLCIIFIYHNKLICALFALYCTSVFNLSFHFIRSQNFIHTDIKNIFVSQIYSLNCHIAIYYFELWISDIKSNLVNKGKVLCNKSLKEKLLRDLSIFKYWHYRSRRKTVIVTLK